MTELDQAVVLIQKQISSNWTETPILFDNDPVTNQEDPHLRVSCQIGETQPNLDSSFERTRGIAFLQVIVPKGRGDLVAWGIAKRAAKLLKYKTLGGVRLTSASFTNVGILGDALEQDSGWFQINVSVPFWFEDYPS